MRLHPEGEALIKHYEGCRLQAYQDQAGVWTIGYGNTYYENGSSVKRGDIIPQWRADELFRKLAPRYATVVGDLLAGVRLKTYQSDALISFVWNLGAASLEDSTLLRVIREDPGNYREIERQFCKWRLVKGRVSAGLYARRQSEAWLYRTGELKWF